MHLPKSGSTSPAQALVAFLSQPNDPLISTVPDSKVLQQIPGKLVKVDWRGMVTELRANDPPMSFYSSLYRIPGFTLAADRLFGLVILHIMIPFLDLSAQVPGAEIRY